jgi:hypothetical protein
LLFGQPSRTFYANEIIALAQSGSGAVQRELARLARGELVVVQLLGRQKHYQANPDSPIYAELCGIASKTTGLAEPLRAALGLHGPESTPRSSMARSPRSRILPAAISI